MSELSTIGKIMWLLKSATEIKCGLNLDPEEVVELLGHIRNLEEECGLLDRSWKWLLIDAKTYLSRAEKAEAEEKEWREIAERSNQLLRSAYSIAQRKGVDTNWDAFERCLEKELVLQHNYRADLINKISVDVKRDLSDAEIEELGAREAENGN